MISGRGRPWGFILTRHHSVSRSSSAAMAEGPRGATTVLSWRWGSADSTTTTSIRPGTRNARPSRPRSTWPTVTTSPWSCTADAWDDTLDVLRAGGPPARTVLHCFTGGPQEARRCLDIGAFLSFSGIVTFKGAQDVRDAAALCPLDRLMVETDAPFLAPVPHRGKQNRPAWVVDVGTALSEIKGVSPASMAETCTSTTRAAFALS